MKIEQTLLNMLRAAVAVQLALGIALWTGHGYQFAGVHQMVGVVFVLVLWLIALIALVRRVAPGLAAVAIVWGLLIAALGMTQQRIMTGDMHWLVRVVHLAIGLAAMPMAERLSRRAP